MAPCFRRQHGRRLVVDLIRSRLRRERLHRLPEGQIREPIQEKPTPFQPNAPQRLIRVLCRVVDSRNVLLPRIPPRRCVDPVRRNPCCRRVSAQHLVPRQATYDTCRALIADPLRRSGNRQAPGNRSACAVPRIIDRIAPVPPSLLPLIHLLQDARTPALLGGVALTIRGDGNRYADPLVPLRYGIRRSEHGNASRDQRWIVLPRRVWRRPHSRSSTDCRLMTR